jgi:class 3 adenylate cyclase/tetratricopeptide (TPR) repeat protein
MTVQTRPVFRPYLPQLVVDWRQQHPDARFAVVPGSLVSVDISGFTSLSERLQAKGRVGAEELILLISGVFEGLIGIAHRHGGDVLKFRGDALLLIFSGPEHEVRACRAASEMQWLVEETGETMSSVGPVRLGMATGVHSGDCHFFLVGSTHLELVVTGPAATAVVKLEDAAETGEVLVSTATAAALEPGWIVGERDGDVLVRVPHAFGGAAPAFGDTAAEEDLDSFVPEPLRRHLALEAGEGEHRMVTVAFLKFSGTDVLLAREGAEAVYQELEQLGRALADVAAELGITWLESDVDVDGGKLYLVAGAPTSSGEDEERMLRTLQAILEAPTRLTLRAGVNRGPAFAGDVGAVSRRTYAVMGDTVNLAARLTARAEPGNILASADVLERSRTRFETSHQPFLMKGKDRPVVAYTVGAATGVREQAVERLPLVGRNEELDSLRRAVDSARVRQFQLVELVGEPGIGKSRLVEELKTLAVGFQHLESRCEAYESSHAFFAVRSLLRPLAGLTPEQTSAEAGAQLAPFIQTVMPDLAPWLPLLAVPFDAEVPSTPETDAVDAAFRRDKLHDVVLQFMARVLLMPTLLVVEDVHWIDDASAFLLRHLAASPLPRPWLVCVTRRPEGEAFSAEGHGTQLALAPLPDEAAASLALSAAGDLALSEFQLETLTERAGGNPLFVRELIGASRAGAGADVLPESVETLLTSRIDRLDPADRLLLRYASVLGPRFDVGVLEEILVDELVEPGDLERWQRLSEFVERDSSESLRFRHDLFRAMAYEGLSFRRRREIHGKVGAALEARAEGSTDEVAGLLSLHFLEGGELEKAWRYSVAAGRRAQTQYANVVAAELYERALAAAEQLAELPVAEVLPVLEALGDVATLFAGYERAEQAYGRALDLAAGDPVARTRLMRKIGVSVERLGRREEGLGWFDRALAELDAEDGGTDGVASRVALEIAYAGSLYYRSRYEECIRWAEQAVMHAEEIDLSSEIAHACYILSLASAQAGRPEPSYAQRALAIYEQTGELVGHGILLNNLGLEAFEAYRWDEAVERYRRAAELSERAGDVASVARVHVNEADVLAERGLLDEAEQRLRDALRVWRAASYPLAIAITSSNLGRVLARAGRTEEALALLEDAKATFTELGNPAWAAEATARIAEGRVVAGEHREALEAASGALEEAHAAGAPPVLEAMIERLIGYAHVQGRRPGEAAPHLERSLELARELGAEFEVALTLKAAADSGLAGPEAARESEELLARLGVVTVPRVPLP